MRQEDDELEAEFLDEDEADNSAATVRKLRERLKKAVEEKQEYVDGWQRARAEFTNYKKREEVGRMERAAWQKSEIVEKLLSTLDALELAIKHEHSNKTLTMIEKQFLGSLKSLGVEKYGALGDEVDPQYYEPLSSKAVEGEEQDHKVVSVERSGYKMGELVIRPAQVIVGIFSNKESS